MVYNEKFISILVHNLQIASFLRFQLGIQKHLLEKNRTMKKLNVQMF